jgi:putative zinc finger protein
MNDHQCFEDQLPFYAAHQLPPAERDAVEQHLLNCPACRADLKLWQAVGDSIRAESSSVVLPLHLADRALEQIHARHPLQRAFVRAWQLLNAQAMLVQRELWPACAAVMAIGVTVALLAEKASVIQFLAPLIAAAGLATLYGPERDPATELALATPTSSWKILLARLTLVSGYNLLLAMAASVALLAIVPPDVLGSLIVGWLGPMAFLSALALLLSLWVDTNNAVTLVYGLWLGRYFLDATLFSSGQFPLAWLGLLSAYQQFWQSPALLLVLSLALLGAAMLSVHRSERFLSQTFV